jgi:hypothetical protein
MYPGLFLEDGKPRMDPGKQISSTTVDIW